MCAHGIHKGSLRIVEATRVADIRTRHGLDIREYKRLSSFFSHRCLFYLASAELF